MVARFGAFTVVHGDVGDASSKTIVDEAVARAEPFGGKGVCKSVCRCPAIRLGSGLSEIKKPVNTGFISLRARLNSNASSERQASCTAKTTSHTNY